MTRRAGPLDPQVEAILAAGADLPLPRTAEEAREQYSLTALRFAGPAEDVASVYEFAIDGELRVRAYAPEEPHGAVLWCHGGGWCMGTLDAYDPLCRALANRSGACVVAVDYRLAPEHPFPAPLEDCERALDWLLGEAGRPVAVAGDSAGGNLAAVLARRRRDDIAFQILVYPAVDAAMATDSYRVYGSDRSYGLSREDMATCWAAYAPHPAGRSPDASPIRARDLDGLPPAFVLLAQCDPLADEGQDYADRLRAAGVPVEVSVWPGTVHGFLRWRGGVDVAHRALDEAAAAMRGSLAPA